MSEDAGGEWLTVPEAARRVGIGERKAYRHAAKLSDSDVKVSDTGQRLVRQSALERLTGGGGRQTEATDSPPLQSDLEAEPVSQPSDSSKPASDKARDVSDDKVEVSDTAGAGAEVRLLRKDLARVEDENRFMREQLALAMSGWREEQRRSREYERRMKELTGPVGDALLESTPTEAGTDPSVEAPEADAGGRAGSTPVPQEAGQKPAGLWARMMRRRE